MIPIDRSKGKYAFKSVVAHGKKRLADGQWIIMFPEGTRIPVGQVGKYKSGGTRLAIETGALVVPIAHNSGECWPKGSFVKRPGLVTVSIGKPISPEGHTPDSMMQEVQNWIESEMRVISPHAYKGG
jgi:1-acyl-sn-glycerol-3-phosphate acyltransferase